MLDFAHFGVDFLGTIIAADPDSDFRYVISLATFALLIAFGIQRTTRRKDE